MVKSYQHTIFGLLKGVHISSESAAFGPANISRFDALPDGVKLWINKDLLDAWYNPFPIKLGKGNELKNVYPVVSLMGGGDVRDFVDPIEDKYFIYIEDFTDEDGSIEKQDALIEKMILSLTALRLSTRQPVSVVCPNIVLDSGGNFTLMGFGARKIEMTGFMKGVLESHITDEKIQDANLLYDFIEREKSLEVVFKRLNISIGRNSYEDSLIDLMIGLESLYLPDGNSELAYRLKVRCSHHISTNPEKRKLIFNDIGDLYKIRSRIVHGSSNTFKDACVKTVFYDNPVRAISRGIEILSDGISKCLIDQGRFSVVDRSKRFDELIFH